MTRPPQAEPTLDRRKLLGAGAVTAALAASGIASRALGEPRRTASGREIADVVVYGGTMAAVTAAIQVQRMGKSVVIVSPDAQLGGMTTSGLGWTDAKWEHAIGGMAREFYRSIWHLYTLTSAWDSIESRREYQLGVTSQAGPSIDDAAALMWNFEPRAAQKVLGDWLKYSGVPVRYGRIDRVNGVNRRGSRITAITTEDGASFAGRVFIDATYEGDLMAAGGVPYRVGRDAASLFSEQLGGILIKDNAAWGTISPYVTPHHYDSGYAWGIEGDLDPATFGQPDPTRVQAYCFRLCLTSSPANQLPIERPADYDPARYELLFRYYERGKTNAPFTDLTRLPNQKLDGNNNSSFSFDFIGGNRTPGGVPWPEASYAERAVLWESHRSYQLGYLWAMRTEARIPEPVRAIANAWSLAADEFTSTGGWPPQLYIREGRRLIGASTITEQHVQYPHQAGVGDPIGLGTYALDSHGVRRVVIDRKIRTEGSFYRTLNSPWKISYGAIVPANLHTTNLLVPAALSATHAAFGSVRMEPTYMVLGQSAGAAAVLAVNTDTHVQHIKYSRLAGALRKHQQRIDFNDMELPERW